MVGIRLKFAVLAVGSAAAVFATLIFIAALVSGGPDTVFVGDSITANWPGVSPATWKRSWADKGIGGQRSDEVRARFERDVVALHPRAVHILVGINDIGGRRGLLPLKETEANIAAMATMAREAGIRVVLGTLAHVPQSDWLGGPDGNVEVDRLNAWIRSYAASTGASVADYQSEMSPTLTSDGVHPNAEGYTVMARVARRALT